MRVEPTPERLAFLSQKYSQGIIADLGIKATHYERGYLEAQLIISPPYRQQDQYIHAGVLATLADHTAGYATFSLVSEDLRISVRK
ncbi:MAG: PaaI family thioesterase [Syntrophales bacterium LBB04]|nr:PaaI family thioesterase [Syntrophales bacterium LBB04]